MAISNQQDTMDAEIKNLRIDRSAKHKNRSGRNLLRWILLSFGLSVLLGVGVFIYGRLNTAVEVETARARAASNASSGIGAGATILNAPATSSRRTRSRWPRRFLAESPG